MDNLPNHAYEILRYLNSDEHESEQHGLLNHFQGKINETKDLLFALDKCGLIACKNSLVQGDALINITHLGRTALSAHDEEERSLQRQISALEDVAASLSKDLDAAQAKATAQAEAMRLAQAQVAALERQAEAHEKGLLLAKDERASAQAHVAALERQAEALEKGLELAKSECASAKEAAIQATVRSWISIAVALMSVVASLLAWLFPR